MERVRRYCTMCSYRKERAVFTREQWNHIAKRLGVWRDEGYPFGNDHLFGVPITIDDTPRPAMRL